MAPITETRSPIASKLTLVCALALAASTFASDAPIARLGVEPFAAHKPFEPSEELGALGKVSALLAMAKWMGAFFDAAHQAVLAEKVPDELLRHQPFATIAEILGRALQEVKPLKGTGELGPDGDNLIYALADARYKADRNANLIRQMTVDPITFVSAIDRDGLIVMAEIARAADSVDGA